jgi:hypothetical protein
MNKKIIVKLERHNALKTNAKTYWILPRNAKLIYSTKHLHKTHWLEYYLVDKNEELIMIRISNRNNKHVYKFKASDLRITDNEYQELLMLMKNHF